MAAQRGDAPPRIGGGSGPRRGRDRHGAPALLRLLASVLVRGPEREQIRGDLDELLARDLERGVPPLRALRRYLGNLLGSAWSTWRGGVPARTEAERRLGRNGGRYGFATTRRRVMRLGDWLFTVRHDARLTVRSFRREPGFAVAVITTLTLGIGATVAIFTLVHGVLLRPLPYADPGRLYAVVDRVVATGDPSSMSPLELTELRRRTTAFAGLAGVTVRSVNLTGDGPPQQLPVQLVSGNFFELLGVPPLLGGVFTQENEQPGSPLVVVLSHGFWQGRFGGDPDVVGRTVVFNDRPREIIGVMPEGFRYGDFDAALWLAMQGPPNFPGRFLEAFGRLRPVGTADQASAELESALSDLAREEPRIFGWGLSIELVPLRDRLIGDSRPVLYALTGAVVLLLLIASANVANLLLARALRRRQELAVRMSLGAGRTRIVRQLLTESALMAAVGGAAGVLLATAAIRLIVARLPEAIALPRASEISADIRMVAIAIGVTALATLLFGLAPALTGTRPKDQALVVRGSRGSTGAPALGKARGMLVVVQVALVSVLLLGAGLLGRSFVELHRVELGLVTEGVLVADLPYAGAGWPDPRAFHRELMERVRAVPGVSATGLTQNLPLSGVRSTTPFLQEGSDRRLGSADIRVIHGDALQAMGTRLVAGRAFTEQDDGTAPDVFLVNRTLARSLEGDVLGRRIAYEWGSEVDGEFVPIQVPGEIVGVVEDVHESGPALEAAAALYRPWEQDPNWPMMLVVRTAGDADAVARSTTAIVHELDPKQPVPIKPLEQYASTLVARPRMQFFLIGLFASVALTLAAVGLYGVIGYAVDQRRQELGVRLAIGATPGRVTGLVVRQGLRFTVAGLGLGAAAATLVLPALRSLVFGVRMVDPLAVTGTVAVILLIAGVASALPARRAARIDPMSALKAE